MTETQVPIAFGKVNATALSSAALPAGSLIVNNDASNSVWISGLSSMQSGYGIEVGPKGSATWSNDGPCYAILDTAATADVTLYVTQALSDVTDPVAIGAAVATKLLASGVPNVFLNPLIVAGFMDSLHLTLGPYDISKYASLIIQVSTASTDAALRYDMHQELPYDPAAVTITETLTNIDGPNFNATWCIPVNGASIKFTNVTGRNMTIAVYGSNRQVSSAFQYNNTLLPRKFLYIGNANAGVPVPLPVNDGNPLTSTSFNRMVSARCGVGAISGSIGYQYTDSSGVTRTNFVALSIPANTSVNVSFAHPLTVCKWIGQSVTTGATSFTLDLAPEAA